MIEHIDDMIEDWVVELSIDNGGYKPAQLDLELFLQANNFFFFVEDVEFYTLAEKWCQK